MGESIIELKRQARSTDEEVRLQAIKALYDSCNIRGIPVL